MAVLMFFKLANKLNFSMADLKGQKMLKVGQNLESSWIDLTTVKETEETPNGL